MKTEVKYLGNTEGELFTSWHYVPCLVVATEIDNMGNKLIVQIDHALLLE